MTRSKAQTNVKAFVRHACKENRQEVLDAFSTIYVEDSPPKPFTEAELQHLLAQVPKTFDAVKAPIITALIHLQVSTGLAIRDAIQLERSHLAGGWLRIKRQKMKKSSGGNVAQKLDPALYQELLAVLNGNPRYVFYNSAANPERVTKLWLGDLQRLMKDAGVYIKGNVSHRFRDTFVDYHIGHGTSLADIAAMLGDRQTTVEKHYANLLSQRGEERMKNVPVRTWAP
jgi:integrase